ncbi:MAG: metalloregulator ArsR/SmtB family transcription factor [Candidatus Bathyarchaeia archaeon]
MDQFEQSLDDRFISEKSRLFKALANETRLKILMLLDVRGEMCVCELMSALGLTQPTISHHLGILKNAGLIRERKSGKWVYYRITDARLMENMRKLSLL